ncbi:DUF4198 domain containing protein [Sulfitobacter noctilucicola]|uniref:Putative GH25 family protein n=1 Tax=Sulfitobacter noctilucicola TaxID=1342301 RepID=A0A7W6M793_9RHOB|nr:DUF4198 domain-containing protein [Sulfitobacter noctilucicola]KIN65114.1 DUF4198 domain containing protein [Sulfitobacter noctilucicola]MBB4173749.1 putative GH25 family protein [Sulfitobacter noctilucicola]
MYLSRLFAVAVSLIAPVAALSHEFWIEPLKYQVDSGETLQANFKNGQLFEGNSLSFFDRSSARFEMIVDGNVQALTPRAGDSPAFDVIAPERDALVTVVHETTASKLTYSEWEKFLKFAEHKDFTNAAADHAAAGWPQDKFRESYTRHAKALIAVGNGEGADEAVGMETEFVAITNPYASTFDNNMKVLVLYKGKPRADAQVEVFDRSPDDSVTVTLHRTDADGMAVVPVTPGHSYLFDAVVLRPVADPVEGPNPLVWETLWAALTFAVPAK